jgi:glycosyltransferase involved in cell wall biosynthesis
MRILHAIHDFLPRHAAGSEIYAFQLCRELAKRHDVRVLAAEYDPARAHGSLTWRVHDGLPVIELVNNWEGAFADSWRSPRLGSQLAHVLRATQPDVLHVHSLLNLSFELPAMARERGAAVAATLHDHSLVCPAGGQRLHLTERTVCDEIVPDRCAACFSRSPLHAQMAVGGLTRTVGRGGGWPGGAARWAARQAPGAAAFFARRVLPRTHAVTGAEISVRLDGLRAVFDAIQLFAAPSASVADAHAALGLDRSKLLVSDNGFVPRPARHASGADAEGALPSAVPRQAAHSPLRIGFVGTLVWHKGVHVLLEAARALPADRYALELWGSLETFPDYVKQLQVLARGLPARLCGGFDPEDAQAVYDRLDVLVVPSLWPENSPLVIHEAFMAGVPVVGARIGGIPELVSDGVSGVLYDPGSSATLSAALRSLIDDPARIARMAAHLPPVKTIEADARDWERRYETLMGTPS